MSKKTTRKSFRKKKSKKIWGSWAGVGGSERWVKFRRRFFYLLLIGVWLTAVELARPPSWAGEELLEEVRQGTGLAKDDFLLDEGLTDKLLRNLLDQDKSPWVKHVNQVRRRYDGKVIVDCELRRPIASISRGGKLRYVDMEGVVLPMMPLEGRDNHLVRMRGVDMALPGAGEPINSPAVLAGIEVLALIRGTDEKLERQERLWEELAVMDVSNYEGRKDPVKPHLVLYTQNNTEIRWGAAAGRSRPYYEASVEAKLSMLYRNHRLQNSLEVFEYVDLRNRRQERSNPLRGSGKGDG